MTITLADFEEALDRYGPELERWPADMREPAGQLRDGDPRVRALLDREQRLHGFLRQAVAVQPVSSAQLGRLMSSLEAKRRPARDYLPFMGTPRHLFAALGVAALIFTCGAWTGSVIAQDDMEQIDLAALDVYTQDLGIEP